jgi:hypothetical protein
MRLDVRIYAFVNACFTAAQACKGCMTRLPIVVAVVRDARLAARARDSRAIRLRAVNAEK